jgi:hypothetical protein
MEFNADGSLKMGASAAKKHEEDEYKMRNSRCIMLVRDATKTFSPKLCRLTIEVSPLMEEGFIPRVFNIFSKRVDTTMSLTAISSREYEVIVGGEFSRCRDCNFFVNSLREGLSGNIIEKKGTCTFKGNQNI